MQQFFVNNLASSCILVNLRINWIVRNVISFLDQSAEEPRSGQLLFETSLSQNFSVLTVNSWELLRYKSVVVQRIRDKNSLTLFGHMDVVVGVPDSYYLILRASVFLVAQHVSVRF